MNYYDVEFIPNSNNKFKEKLICSKIFDIKALSHYHAVLDAWHTFSAMNSSYFSIPIEWYNISVTKKNVE